MGGGLLYVNYTSIKMLKQILHGQELKRNSENRKTRNHLACSAAKKDKKKENMKVRLTNTKNKVKSLCGTLNWNSRSET